jgi:N-acetyltransferase
MTAQQPPYTSLVGAVVRLDPMEPIDAMAMFRALTHPAVWESGFSRGRAARPRNAGEMAGLCTSWSAPGRYPYTVRLCQTSEVVGTTSLLDVSLADERIHIGNTGYAPHVWGTAVNPECKLLLLTHVFDDCGYGRVKLQADAINHRSIAAIATLGAVREGVLRRHMSRADGTFRDSVVFSILREEWPAVRARLSARIALLAPDTPPRR